MPETVALRFDEISGRVARVARDTGRNSGSADQQKLRVGEIA